MLDNAHLEGAGLGGADLEGAELTGAKADAKTKWPPDFDPQAAGVIFVDRDEAQP